MPETPASTPATGEGPAVDPEAPSAAAAAGKEAAPPTAILRGTAVAPGVALGHAHRKDYALQAPVDRVPVDGIERELNRFHAAVVEARSQLVDLKQRISGVVPVDDARILDVHAAYLKDSVFISDVENLILNEQLTLEAAIVKVISDFDRIFRLVKNETLRDRAVDLRDVGIRVLRHLERNPDQDESQPLPTDYVLVARELSIVDMFNVRGDHVRGILTEEGAVTGHAAILARSMGIPTLIGVTGLLDTVREGDFVIIDGAEGVVRVNPDEVVRAQYAEATRDGEDSDEAGVPDWAEREPQTLDGERIAVGASCGNLPEVEQAAAFGLGSIGLYRTELLYLVDKDMPSVDSLASHYAAVVSAARGGPVTFRLLHVDSSLGLGWMHEGRELNPALGVGGVRALLAREKVLREQLQAILQSTVGVRARIAVPFVTDNGELRRVKEILFEERLELRKAGASFQEKVAVGAVVETPAAVIGARDLARESDFLMIGLDGLVQHLLASDRENHALAPTFVTLHPMVLRALKDVVAVCAELEKPLSVFGVTSRSRLTLPFVVGAGVRDFCVPPAYLRDFLRQLSEIDARSARRSTARAAAMSSPAEARSLVDGYHHGHARS